ncbi:MAG: peptidoglycan peptidase [Endomicrobia bacterium]|nr:peptidoglycan peptidase [Endomicrobiia bacterium]MCL2507305.1 peptidoglycan peptidase [Endomicrobiia bacterium]
MGFKILKILPVFILLLSFVSCGSKEIDKSLFKEGDIVFQNRKARASDFTVILSNSKYNNVGILYTRGGKWYVFEASQPVELIPFNSWVKEGENNHFVLKRLKEEETIMTKEAIAKIDELIKEFLGRPFDSKYEWSDKAFYPSELVWKVFERALNIELSPLQTLADFNLSNETIKSKIKEIYGNNVPLYEELVTPAAIYASPHLITIIEN